MTGFIDITLMVFPAVIVKQKRRRYEAVVPIDQTRDIGKHFSCNCLQPALSFFYWLAKLETIHVAIS